MLGALLGVFLASGAPRLPVGGETMVVAFRPSEHSLRASREARFRLRPDEGYSGVGVGVERVKKPWSLRSK